jgi:hypothetical protein
MQSSIPYSRETAVTNNSTGFAGMPKIIPALKRNRSQKGKKFFS